MNADITLNSIVFKRSYDDKSGSLRRDTSRGLNLPQDLSIKSSTYVDSATKVAGQRFVVRIDRSLVGVADGRKAVASAYVVLAFPENADQTDVVSVLATFRATIAAEGLIEGVLNFER